MITKGSSAIEYSRVVSKVKPSRGFLFGILILGALLAFEIFNYSTTDFALTDLLGDLRFSDIRWATILAIAFCGIDFAGIARLFTPEKGAGEPKEVWYLFGAWLLAATMNAILTWWGVAIAILSHDSLGGSVLSPGDDDQGGTGIRCHHGVGHPCAHHRLLLGGGRPAVQPI